MAISNAKRTQILEMLGNPADVDRELQEFRESARVLSLRHPRLIDRYPKQWVAIYEGKVAAHGATLSAVMHQLEKMAIPRERAVVRFIDKNHRTMIL